MYLHSNLFSFQNFLQKLPQNSKKRQREKSSITEKTEEEPITLSKKASDGLKTYHIKELRNDGDEERRGVHLTDIYRYNC